jgi:hypothetical protein
VLEKLLEAGSALLNWLASRSIVLCSLLGVMRGKRIWGSGELIHLADCMCCRTKQSHWDTGSRGAMPGGGAPLPTQPDIGSFIQFRTENLMPLEGESRQETR